MKIKLILSIFLVFCQWTTWSQQNKNLSELLATCKSIEEGGFDKDSLMSYASEAYKLSQTLEDSREKALSRMYYGAAHFHSDSTKFFSEINKSLKISNSINFYEGVALSQMLLARKLNDVGDFETSLEHFDLAEAAIGRDNELNHQRKNLLLAKIYYLRCSVYQSTAEYKKALEVGHKSLDYAELSQDSLVLFKSLNNLSVIYGELSSPEKALVAKNDQERYGQLMLKHLTQAHRISQKMNIPMQRAVSGFNLALLHYNNKEYDDALKILYDVVPATYEAKMPDLRYYALNVMGELFLETNSLDSAEYYIRKSVALAKNLDAPYFKIDANYSLSNLFLKKGDLTKASNYALSGLSIAENEGRLKNQKSGNELLYEIQQKKGDYKSALEYFKKFKSIEDSILTEKSASEIKELTEKYQSEVKENQIIQLKNKSELQELRLKQKNRALISIFVGGVLISLLIFLIFRNKTLNIKKEAISVRQKLLRTQLNPHFIFNALNSIQQFIYQKKDPQVTADYLAKFARLTRRILNYSKEDYILLTEEIAFLEDYMDLQMIRFDVPFEYRISVDEEIDEAEVLIPPMFTQPFIENSIEHGILDKQETGKIEIKITKDDAHLIIQIEDNGVGREKAEFKILNREHRSMATRITMERLRQMEKLLKKRTKLAIEDILTEDNLIIGTKVRLHIPLRLI